MAHTHFILRYGELFLKGKNRLFFERQLIKNISKIAGIKKVIPLRNRLILEVFPKHQCLKRVFGLVSYSPTIKVEKDLEIIKRKAVEILTRKEGTFRVEAQRSDKSFPFKSPDLNQLVGSWVEKHTPLEFKREKPDHLLGLEINEAGAFLFTETYSCGGGLPTGVEGKALLLVEGEASLLAGLWFMRRGASIFPVSWNGPKDLSLLQKFSPDSLTLKTVQNWKEVETYAQVHKIEALISGQDFAHFKRYETSLTVFRPLAACEYPLILEELKKFERMVTPT